jgi:hypothetical protein
MCCAVAVLYILRMMSNIFCARECILHMLWRINRSMRNCRANVSDNFRMLRKPSTYRRDNSSVCSGGRLRNCVAPVRHSPMAKAYDIRLSRPFEMGRRHSYRIKEEISPRLQADRTDTTVQPWRLEILKLFNPSRSVDRPRAGRVLCRPNYRASWRQGGRMFRGGRPGALESEKPRLASRRSILNRIRTAPMLRAQPASKSRDGCERVRPPAEYRMVAFPRKSGRCIGRSDQLVSALSNRCNHPADRFASVAPCGRHLARNGLAPMGNGVPASRRNRRHHCAVKAFHAFGQSVVRGRLSTRGCNCAGP